MAIIVTPRGLALRAELYHQIGSLLAAGLPLIKALETLVERPPTRSFREPLQRLIAALVEGETFTRALSHAQDIPLFDLALLQAGEESGRLPESFRLLADYYRERASQVRSLLGGLAYPVFLFHFAVFIGPFPQFFQSWDLSVYLRQTLGLLIPIYAVVLLLVFALQAKRAESWRALVEEISWIIPGLGHARRSLALARLSAALGALITAGVSIIHAWQMAGAASGSPRFWQTVRSWKNALENGERTPSELLAAAPVFPVMFSNLYHGGEISGSLDDVLLRLRHHYQEEGTRQMRSFIKIFSTCVYLVIVIKVALQIMRFYRSHYEGIFNQF